MKAIFNPGDAVQVRSGSPPGHIPAHPSMSEAVKVELNELLESTAIRRNWPLDDLTHL